MRVEGYTIGYYVKGDLLYLILALRGVGRNLGIIGPILLNFQAGKGNLTYHSKLGLRELVPFLKLLGKLELMGWDYTLNDIANCFWG